jgi:hypothetical protein
MQEQKAAFAAQGYCVVREAISRDAANIATTCALFHQSINGYYKPEPEFNAWGRYVDTLGESILLQVQSTVEAVSGNALYPCYSFLRIYGNGAVLPRHVDRPSCEISATLTLGYKADSIWPFFAGKDEAGTEVALGQGDFLVYRGAEVPHWRNAFEGEYWVQLFLHYVRVDGEFADLKYDRRSGIGTPASTMKTGRNEPCICGSGLKYKDCHGKLG